MRRPLRYTDAVKLLAGGENQLIKLLDDASATMLLGAGVFDLFEAREQALRLLNKVLDKFGEKLRGIDRLTRTERIHAAHEVIRITAYFDAFSEAMGEFQRAGAVRLSAAQQASVAAGTESDLGWRQLFQALGRENSFGSLLWDCTSLGIFHNISSDLLHQLTGLAIWDALDETEQARLSTLLKTEVPGNAAERYQENLRRLSADCPEFGVWVNLQAHAETRAQLAAGLAGLETMLAPLAASSATRQQASLSRAYQAALAKPILLTSGPESGLTLPSLGEGYVDHNFRLSFGIRVTNQDWEQCKLRHDLPTLLATYLMSEDALSTPLLVLGQPGSGKSVLTRILAARLPAERFLPIRVELRHVNAEAELQDYIESAIREQTGENVQWTRFVTADPELTPVVLLDGFDELLQATGVAQTDFLLRAARFQERELDQGRSVAVIVTSRTAVANRATLPPSCPVIRLEPFDDEQIKYWVHIWNQTNGASLAARGVKPLSTDTVLQYRTLAGQPLLLLMLALYDATANALSAAESGMKQGTVYEQLLKDFARRELTKDPDVTDLDRRVEQELLRLSVVAFAMFNRGAQWIDAESLTQDLRALGIWEAERNQNTFRSTLSAGQQMVGRFFFIHDVQATRDGGELQTYEFLHATFSEYLVARLVVTLLAELAAQHRASMYSVSPSTNDALLYALLSFDCLAARLPIIEFAEELIDQQDPAIRDAMAEVVTKLFHGSLMERTDRTYADYQPSICEIVTRAGCWNANLFLLLVLVKGKISMRTLYPEKPTRAVYEWHRLTNLWRSCVGGEGWDGLADHLIVDRTWVDEHPDVVIQAIHRPTYKEFAHDMKWSYHTTDASWHDGDRWDSHSLFDLLHRSNFLVDRRMDVAMHNMTPLAEMLPNLGNTLYNTRDGRLVTAMHLLISALVAPYVHRRADDEIIELARSLKRLPQTPEREAEFYWRLALSLLITAVESDSVSDDTRRQLNETLRGIILTKDAQVLRLWQRFQRHVIMDAALTAPTPPAPAASPLPEPSPAASSPATRAMPPAAP